MCCWQQQISSQIQFLYMHTYKYFHVTSSLQSPQLFQLFPHALKINYTNSKVNKHLLLLLLLLLKGARISNERVCDVLWICNKYFMQTIHTVHSCNLIKIAFITVSSDLIRSALNIWAYNNYILIHTNNSKIYILQIF